MPRSARAEYEPGLYHVYARGNRKEPIYLDDVDRWRYLGMLRKTVNKTGWMCLSYCLMGNHMHLLIETRQPNLGWGMHGFHGGYAQYFNRRHGFCGHLFQDRFKGVPIESDAQLCMTAAYIARNPVRAGLCATPEDWQWSSHAAIRDGMAPSWIDAARLESYFGAAGGDGRHRYVELVALLANLKRDSPSLGGVYGPDDSERSRGRTNQKSARRAKMAAGAA